MTRRKRKAAAANEGAETPYLDITIVPVPGFDEERALRALVLLALSHLPAHARLTDRPT